MVVLLAMPTDTDDEPTIEVRVITLLDLLEFMGDLGPSSSVTAGSPGGSRKRRRRDVLGLTLEQLAERAALVPNYIGTIETGRRAPLLSEMVAMARALGVAPGELFGPLPDLSPSAVELFERAPREILDALRMILRSVRLRRKPPAPDSKRNNDGGDGPSE
jgi:transcriptional regulator with XRE-family HTH domain